MERLYRLVCLGLFIVGFVGAIASADRTNSFFGFDELQTHTESLKPSTSLIHDIRLVEEVNAINEGQWNQDHDINDLKTDSLARIEKILSQSEPTKITAQNN